jgi:hypothetical protein
LVREKWSWQNDQYHLDDVVIIVNYDEKLAYIKLNCPVNAAAPDELKLFSWQVNVKT